MYSKTILTDCDQETYFPLPMAPKAILPRLEGTERAAFAGQVYCRTLKPGAVLYQAQRSKQSTPGRWFGIAKPESSSHAELLFNIRKWGNDASWIVQFQVLRELTGYWGFVAGGLGIQFFVPPTIALSDRISHTETDKSSCR